MSKIWCSAVYDFNVEFQQDDFYLVFTNKKSNSSFQLRSTIKDFKRGMKLTYINDKFIYSEISADDFSEDDSSSEWFLPWGAIWSEYNKYIRGDDADYDEDEDEDEYKDDDKDYDNVDEEDVDEDVDEDIDK